MPTTKDKINEFKQKEKELIDGSGEKGIEKQHKKNKLTARERISAFFDPYTFQEYSLFSHHHCTNFGMENKKYPTDGVITGTGAVNQRLVAAFSQDFTIGGGATGETQARKIVDIMELARKCGAPLVGFNDGAGARIQEGVQALSGYGKIFYHNTLLSGVVPQISIIAGPCAGGAAYSPALTDFIIMVNKNAQMFITGPQVLKSVTGEVISMEELGGANAHAIKSGNCHFVVSSDREAIEVTQKLLSFLPSNNLEDPPLMPIEELTYSDNDKLNSIIPDSTKEPYDMKKLIRMIVDLGDFLEIHENFAPNIIIGFSRINGRTVGIIANQPSYMAGVLDINSSDKAARFIRFCNVFNIPLVSFVDVPGFLPGVAQEHNGIIRHGAKMLFAFSAATVPKITVVIRKAYGGAYLAMCSKDLGADIVLAWPTAEIAVMGAEGAVKIVYRNEIKNAENKKEVTNEKIAEYRKKFSSPYEAASYGFVDSIIEPSSTRKHLCFALETLAAKRIKRPEKKHGNMPL